MPRWLALVWDIARREVQVEKCGGADQPGPIPHIRPTPTTVPLGYVSWEEVRKQFRVAPTSPDHVRVILSRALEIVRERPVRCVIVQTGVDPETFEVIPRFSPADFPEAKLEPGQRVVGYVSIHLLINMMGESWMPFGSKLVSDGEQISAREKVSRLLLE